MLKNVKLIIAKRILDFLLEQKEHLVHLYTLCIFTCIYFFSYLLKKEILKIILTFEIVKIFVFLF